MWYISLMSCFLVPVSIYPEVEWLDHMVVLFLIFEESPYCFPQWMKQFAFLTVYKSALFSTSAAAKSLQSCPTLCDPIDGSPPGSPVPGILQARTLECVAISFSMHESEKWKWSRSLSDPMDRSLPGSSIHGIFQARVLEWGAIAFSNAWKWKVNLLSRSVVWDS